MSSEDENQPTATASVSPEDPPKQVRKRAATKKAAKKTVKKTTRKSARKVAKSAEPALPEQPDLFATASGEALSSPSTSGADDRFVPGEVPHGSARKAGVVWSSDDPQSSESPESSVGGAVSDEMPSGAGRPQSAQVSSGLQAEDAQPQEHRQDQTGGPSVERREHRNGPGERPARNSKFKHKAGPAGFPNKKGKARWQDKKKRARAGHFPVEFGELLEFELLKNFEDLLHCAQDLRSGTGPGLDFNRIYAMGLSELRAEVAAAAVETPHAPNRDQLINALIAQAGAQKVAISTVGIFEPLEDYEGGLLVYERDSYALQALSAYVPQVFVERYGLQRGHIVAAQLHPHRENESCPFVIQIDQVMGRDPETLSEIVPFTEGIPYYPLERILMESNAESPSDQLSMRVVDCLTPVGFGQRGLIVAPPRTGKTILMQGMANSIQQNYPEAHLIILLIDERPEEVTDFRRQVSGEVISSTFDETAESHVHAAEMVIEKARRMVEVGKDVVILLDSITRLARAYNTTMPNSGKILSGGVEANALQKPKRFFGSARNIEDGGSLTIIATALVETGSKMDEVIFEEFKGTGNMELHLDRGLSDKRIFPALSMDKSGTRKEELLYHPDEMLKIYSLRRAMKGLPSTDAMEMLIQRIKKTKTNAEFLMSVSN